MFESENLETRLVNLLPPKAFVLVIVALSTSYLTRNVNNLNNTCPNSDYCSFSKRI